VVNIILEVGRLGLTAV